MNMGSMVLYLYRCHGRAYSHPLELAYSTVPRTTTNVTHNVHHAHRGHQVHHLHINLLSNRAC